MPVILPLHWLVVAVVVAAACFAAATWRLARNGRVALLVAWWIVLVCALGTLGGLRLLLVWHEIGNAGAPPALPGIALASAELFAVALLPPLVALIVRGRRRPGSRLVVVIIAAVVWSLIGFAVAAVASVGMEYFRVPFLRPPPTSSPG